MSFSRFGQPCLARRAVEILTDQFGKWPHKAAADQIGVTPETWRNWRDGTSKPSTDHLSRLFAKFGPKFISFVCSPFEDAHLDLKAARIDAQIKALERELEDAKASTLVRSTQGGQTRTVGGVLAIGGRPEHPLNQQSGDDNG